MSNIEISHEHFCDEKNNACEIAESMLDELANDYGLQITSDGNGYYQFTGSGIQGEVTIDDSAINLNATLGFLMMAMKPVIEQGIQKKLDKCEIENEPLIQQTDLSECKFCEKIFYTKNKMFEHLNRCKDYQESFNTKKEFYCKYCN